MHLKWEHQLRFTGTNFHKIIVINEDNVMKMFLQRQAVSRVSR